MDIKRPGVLVILLAFFNDGVCQRQGVNGRIAQFRDEVGDAADVVVVGVGNNHPANIFFFAFKVTDVVNDIINARHVFLGELQAHINNNNVTVIFHEGAVATHFFQAAQDHDF